MSKINYGSLKKWTKLDVRHHAKGYFKLKTIKKKLVDE